MMQTASNDTTSRDIISPEAFEYPSREDTDLLTGEQQEKGIVAIAFICLIAASWQSTALFNIGTFAFFFSVGLGIFAVSYYSFAPGESIGRRGPRFIAAITIGTLAYVRTVTVLPPTTGLADLGLQNEVMLRGTVDGKVERPRIGELRFRLELMTPTQNRTRVQLSAPDLPWQTPPQPNEKLTVNARVKLIRAETGVLPAPTSYAAYLLRRGIGLRGRVLKLERDDSTAKQLSKEQFVRGLVTKLGSSDALATILAAIVGERDLLGAHLKQLFRETGTIHLLVVSGSHVGIVFLIASSLTRRVLRRSTWLLNRYSVDVPATITGVVAAMGYTNLVGGDVATSRALFVLILIAWGEAIGRRSNFLRSIGLAFLFVVFLWPGCFFELGCQLTFLALFGLYLGGKWLGTSERKRHRHHYLVATLCYSFFVWLTTTPALLIWFQSFAPLSFALNAIAIPLFSALCMFAGGFLVACCYFSIPGAYDLLAVLVIVLGWCLRGFERLNDLLATTGLSYRVLGSQHAYALSACFTIGVLVITIWLVLAYERD